MSGLAALFGAPHDWVLQTNPGLIGRTSRRSLRVPRPRSRCVPARPCHPVERDRAPARRDDRIPRDVAALATWCTIEWPSGGTPHCSRSASSSPKRLVQILGYVGTIAFSFSFASYARSGGRGRWSVVLPATLAVFFITAMAGSALRQSHLPEYRTPWIAAAAIVTAAVVFAALIRPSDGSRSCLQSWSRSLSSHSSTPCNRARDLRPVLPRHRFATCPVSWSPASAGRPTTSTSMHCSWPMRSLH